ncbi:MAG: NAD(+)/NADH kinase [Planctomycetes bacterium]|nr:NAD(+)/NADH kinase [Planctomycetota bacterium]
MTIAVVFNPIAGAGRAAGEGRRVAESLKDAGHSVVIVETRMEPPSQWLDPELKDCRVIVVAGGDGTVRQVSESAMKFSIPIYHYPLGTENLFSREFGMDRDVNRLIQAIEKGNVRRVDIGRANGRLFLLMVSVGFDAEVVHDLATRRSGGISHASYLGPMVRQFLRFSAAKLEVTVDGERLDNGKRGFVVIANSSQYGLRLNPAPDADMSDGELDVVFFPTASRRALVGWIWRCWRGRHRADKRLIFRRGREVTVLSESPQAFQIDGDRPEAPPEMNPDCDDANGQGLTPLRIEIHAGVLGVLLP